MTTYHEFDKAKIEEALDAVKADGELARAIYARDTGEHGPVFAAEEYSVLAQCISVTVQGHQICLNLPIVGKKCISVPVSLPSGTAAQACLSICTHWGIPTGVKVTISVAGHVVVTKTFGKC